MTKYIHSFLFLVVLLFGCAHKEIGVAHPAAGRIGAETNAYKKARANCHGEPIDFTVKSYDELKNEIAVEYECK